MDSCETCRFWRILGAVNEPKKCHSTAPSPSLTEGKAKWPITGKEEWCGEYEHEDKAAKKVRE